MVLLIKDNWGKNKMIVSSSSQKHQMKLVIIGMLILTSTATSLTPTTTNSYETITTPSCLPIGWEPQNSGTSQDLSAVSFTTTDIGTVVGGTATILRTTDAGTTWNPQTCGVTVPLYGVSFYDGNKGMAVGNEGTILSTTNGGTTWNTFQTGWWTAYYSAHMVTSTIGFAAGVNSIFQPLVTWTTDGWNSKNDVAFYLVHNSVYHEGTLYDVYFVNASTGFTAAAVWNGEGAIARTTNGGWTWDTIYWASNAIYCIHFPTATIGYAAGQGGLIYKTTDGGNTWTVHSSGVSQRINDIWFISEDIGAAVGDTGLILRTEDGGTTWAIQDSGTYQEIHGVVFLDENTGFAVGKTGTILHTTNGGWSNRPPTTPDAPSGPTNGIINVEYEFTASTTDPEGDDVYYWFDWDDGTNSGWLGPYTSGAPVTESHTWTAVGVYHITVKAKDELGHESDISPAHTITITEAQVPILKIEWIVGGVLKVKTLIKNIGGDAANNIAWTITLTGGAFIGKETTGTITSIEPDASETVNSKLILGFGATVVKVTATIPESTDIKEQSGTVLLFFIKL
jgi:photosystem II stability/assembly factor-like uncharacterized protein